MADRQAMIDRIKRIERIKALEGQQGAGDAGESLPEEAQAPDGKLAKGLRALDYQRSAVGAPLLAKALEKLSGRQVVKPGEYEDALKFKSSMPGSAEMMRRAGILTDGQPTEEGQEPGLVNTGFNPLNMAKSLFSEGMSGHKDAQRNVLGLGADIATDPMTYESMGASALAKFAPASKLARGLNVAVNPMEEFMKFRSVKNYKNAFKQLDANSIEKLGKSEAPSAILRGEGFVGNHNQAADALEAVNKTAGETIGDTLSSAAQQGATVDPIDLYKSVVPELQRLKSLGVEKATNLAKAIEEKVAGLWMNHQGPIPVDKANEVKTFLDHQVKSAGFAAGAEAPLAAQAEKEVSNAIRREAPAAVEKVSPSLAEKLKGAMKRFSSTDPDVVGKARTLGGTVKELNGPFGLTAVDLALAGGAGANAYLTDGDLSSNPMLAILLAKKFGQAAMSTPGRTLRGKVAGQLAGPMLDPLVRHAPRSVWEAVRGNNE